MEETQVKRIRNNILIAGAGIFVIMLFKDPEQLGRIAPEYIAGVIGLATGFSAIAKDKKPKKEKRPIKTKDSLPRKD